MSEKEFNLSNKTLESIGDVPEMLLVKDVKEFIKRLKENVNKIVRNSFDKTNYVTRNIKKEIDKLAGEKLI